MSRWGADRLRAANKDESDVSASGSGFPQLGQLRVSVVVPAYNAATTLPDTLESILGQTRLPNEILVIDDGSTDGTGEVVPLTCKAAISVIRKTNGGAASARNLGIERSRGDLIAFIDADDFWDKEKLARQVEVFAKNPAVVASASNWEWEESGVMKRGLRLPARERDRVLQPDGRRILTRAFSMTSSTIMVRRASLNGVRFDERLTTAEDRDLWIRIAASGALWFDSKVLATVARLENSLSSRDVDLDCQCMLDVLSRYTDLVDPHEIRRWEARTYRRWAGHLVSAGKSRNAIRSAWAWWSREWWNLKALWLFARSFASMILDGRRKHT